MNYDEYEQLLTELLDAFNKNKPDIPNRVMNKSIDDLLKAYAKAYNNLFKEVLTDFIDNLGVSANPTQQDIIYLLTLMENRVKELNQHITANVEKEIQKNYLTGNVLQYLATESVTNIQQLKDSIPYVTLNQYTAEQLAQDTMDDLLFATQNTERSLKKLVRSVFQKHLSLAGLEKTGQKEVAKRIREELTKKGLSVSITKEGFVGIIDKAGRKWNLGTYVKMVTSTKMSQAYHGGLQDKAVATGKDLALISRRGASDPCKYFEGVVISMTGATEGFMTYEQCKATGLVFHPNCKHTCYPVRSLEALPDEDIKHHESQLKAMKKFVATYKKSKKK